MAHNDINKMPALEKTSNIYERCEAICAVLKPQGANWTQNYSATACLLTVLNEVADSGKSIEELLGDEGKEWRKKIRDEITPFFTAANNYQNTYLEPSGLLHKNTVQKKTEEFV